MKKSDIRFEVTLDDKNIPQQIMWSADDKPDPGLSETKAISISLWDHKQKNSLRIDLWTNDMPVLEMKRFHINILGGLAQSILTSTGDEFMASEINQLCDRLVDHLKKEKG